MSLETLETGLSPQGLMIMGVVPGDGTATAIIGADRGFWDVFKQSGEASDGQRDPIDRWSKRIILSLAAEEGGEAVFPSDGPPFAPFISWALATGRFWQSPVGMMVHDLAGLMISIRGAIHLPYAGPSAPTGGTPPCLDCAGQPCLAACPVDALSAETGYDVAACRAYLDTAPGQDCMTNGCAARRACPVSQRFGRSTEQSALHMRAFHPK